MVLSSISGNYQGLQPPDFPVFGVQLALQLRNGVVEQRDLLQPGLVGPLRVGLSLLQPLLCLGLGDLQLGDLVLQLAALALLVASLERLGLEPLLQLGRRLAVYGLLVDPLLLSDLAFFEVESQLVDYFF